MTGSFRNNTVQSNTFEDMFESLKAHYQKLCEEEPAANEDDTDYVEDDSYAP